MYSRSNRSTGAKSAAPPSNRDSRQTLYRQENPPQEYSKIRQSFPLSRFARSKLKHAVFFNTRARAASGRRTRTGVFALYCRVGLVADAVVMRTASTLSAWRVTHEILPDGAVGTPEVPT